MRKTTSARRSDLTLQAVESNIEEKLREKRTKYQQLPFEIWDKKMFKIETLKVCCPFIHSHMIIKIIVIMINF